MSREKMSRRDFLIRGGGAGLACAGMGLLSAPSLVRAAESVLTGPPDLAVVTGGDPAVNTLRAIQALGGIERFVAKGARVAVKPNPVTGNRPETASTTNPDVLETVVRLCVEAGAGDVVVLSHDSERNFEGNGLLEAADRGGARVLAANSQDLYRPVPLVRGRLLEGVEVIGEVLDADVFINIPIAKHHGAAEVTLGMKNLMGINWNRGRFHQYGLQQCIADLNTAVRPDLIVMDANRVLLTNGPAGPGETRDALTVVAGTDPVAVDAYSTTLLDRNPMDIGHIRYAYQQGIGEIDLEKLTIEKISL
jgi:uncharacterized protein (DUF362 family)